jgi:predicted Zn-ribbon and HTH transcriptional regulator
MAFRPELFPRKDKEMIYAMLAALRKDGNTWAEIAVIVKKDPHSIEQWYARQKARRPMREEHKSEQKPRKCLKCGEMFDSSGIHNRMCPPCKTWAGTMA